jgi:type II secretory pathway component PulF
MLLSRRLPLSALAELCRVLRHYLGAGLTLRDVFRQQAAKGSAAVQPVAKRIHESLENGDDLEEALKKETAVFPPLFVALATVGEQTGMLPEVFRELEKYFQLQAKLRRQFLTQITWPAIQLFAAVFIVAFVIFILGIVSQSNPGSPGSDPIGIGTGSGPALGFLCGAFSLIGGVLALYIIARRVLRQGALDGFLLRLPVVGTCVEALALTRFCLALRLTLETGMPIGRAVRLSFRATGNEAFTAASPSAEKAVKAGEELTTALTRTHLFPEEFGHIIAVGEESGRLTDVLEQQADHYAEESERRLKTLASFAAKAVWLIVAGIIIFFIFRIVLSVYINPLNEAAGQV